MLKKVYKRGKLHPLQQMYGYMDFCHELSCASVSTYYTVKHPFFTNSVIHHFYESTFCRKTATIKKVPTTICDNDFYN